MFKRNVVFQPLPSLKLTARTWKWMVGILVTIVSFWDGQFSEAMFVLGVYFAFAVVNSIAGWLVLFFLLGRLQRYVLLGDALISWICFRWWVFFLLSFSFNLKTWKIIAVSNQCLGDIVKLFPIIFEESHMLSSGVTKLRDPIDHMAPLLLYYRKDQASM